jgi:hypothetical protein
VTGATIRPAAMFGLGILLALALAGCSPTFPLVPVTGTVRLGGKPLEGAVVVFAPEAQQPGTVPVATGRTDTEGRFFLLTNYEPRSTGKGAVPGRHRVTISKMINGKELPKAIYANKLAAHRKMVREMNLQLSSSEGEQDVFYVEMVPEEYARMETSPLSAEVVAGKVNSFDFALD